MTEAGAPTPTAVTPAPVGGGMIEALAGLGVIILAVLGLAGLLEQTLAAVATIVLGVAFLALGAVVVAWYATAEGAPTSGVAIELLGGLIAIILGILALLDVVPLVLVAVAIVVLGASLLLGSSVMRRAVATAGQAQEAVLATASAQALIGAAAIVLGVLALVGIQREILILSALLALGAGVLMGSVAATTKLMRLVRA
ncbi:MAG: hypothetical protein KatS3mg059_1713 [Thermomicrobiales bacterium]|nr:MAG: hypothetical protein KatS3mg059_1713 [Thermomicrobiales bacterium]